MGDGQEPINSESKRSKTVHERIIDHLDAAMLEVYRAQAAGELILYLDDTVEDVRAAIRVARSEVASSRAPAADGEATQAEEAAEAAHAANAPDAAEKSEGGSPEPIVGSRDAIGAAHPPSPCGRIKSSNPQRGRPETYGA